jgi:AraC family transcriptional regulator of adaptative response/methylated-DNA-[protein]-cysteine methyltransferase
MVAAMRANDTNYDGQFYVCVRTTGIYCLPSCKAKLPILKNVMFLGTREDAIKAGFRGCKRCKSEFYPDVSSPWLGAALSFLRKGVHYKIREQELADYIGVDISTIRRYFKSYMQTTPMAYHRKLRLEFARSLIKGGADYLTAAFESGFESSSGFRDAFEKMYGCSPGRINGH